jgi:hypothetical protein
MSINAELKRLVEEGVLRCVEPFPGDPARRKVLLSAGLDSLLAGASEESRIGRLKANLTDVVAGGEVTLSFQPFKHKNATFGVLSPEEECNWEFRSRDPAPGLRLFGRFADLDTFVGVDWWPRSKPLEGFDKTPLGDRNSLEYQFAQIEVNQFWAKHLPNITPVSGDSCGDYFSERCSVVGAEW